MALGCSLFVATADLAIRLLYDQRYHAASWMLPILVIWAWFSMLSAINELTLLGLGAPSYSAIANGVRFAFLAFGLPLGFEIKVCPPHHDTRHDRSVPLCRDLGRTETRALFLRQAGFDHHDRHVHDDRTLGMAAVGCGFGRPLIPSLNFSAIEVRYDLIAQDRTKILSEGKPYVRALVCPSCA